MHQYVLRRLVGTRGAWPAVAEGAQVSLRTLRKIASGAIADPGVSHIEKLHAYFVRTDRESAPESAERVA